jgi:hypothetical protein
MFGDGQPKKLAFHKGPFHRPNECGGIEGYAIQIRIEDCENYFFGVRMTPHESVKDVLRARHKTINLVGVISQV